jgi:hypothetical protein
MCQFRFASRQCSSDLGAVSWIAYANLDRRCLANACVTRNGDYSFYCGLAFANARISRSRAIMGRFSNIDLCGQVAAIFIQQRCWHPYVAFGFFFAVIIRNPPGVKIELVADMREVEQIAVMAEVMWWVFDGVGFRVANAATSRSGQSPDACEPIFPSCNRHEEVHFVNFIFVSVIITFR